MLRPPTVVAFALVLVVSGAWAQDAEDAMARARRLADGPKRAILEAARIKPQRSGDADAGARTAERTPAKSAAVVVRPGAKAAAPSDAVVSPATGLALPATGPQPPGEPVDLPPATQPAEAAPAEAAPGGEPAATDERASLRRQRFVVPVVPPELAGEIRGDVEFIVSFMVNPDGTLSGAQVESPADIRVNAAVLQAVAQWRYAPIPAARPHEVRLVIRFGD